MFKKIQNQSTNNIIRGFTLIELLAVIIILAVIALIATPLVLDVVDDARSQARENSIYGYSEAIKLAAYEYQFKNNGANPTINEEWLATSVVTKGEKVACEKVTFHETKGVILSGCTVGSDDTLYYYDGNNALTEEPIDFDELFPKVYKCKRALEGTLHTEICEDGALGCNRLGYAAGEIIEYGNIKKVGTKLESGDAFDCDVNGDGTYDSVTERFYYVNSLYDTTENDFDDEYAVLLYYSNTTSGIPNNIGAIPYDSNKQFWNGPIDAIANLPTVEQWKNIKLKNTSRKIVNERGMDVSFIDSQGYVLPSAFNYVDPNGTAYAARLLTYNEISSICLDNSGYLQKSCAFLAENACFAKTGGIGYWLETPMYSSSVASAYAQEAFFFATRLTDYSSNYNARPAIEVLKTDILY